MGNEPERYVMTKLFFIQEGAFCSFTLSEEVARKDAARGGQGFRL